MQHLIQKQVFDIVAPNLQLVRRWESRAGSILHEVITPCIERCFDEVNTNHTVFLIDRLEIDLGVLRGDTSDESIRENVEQAVRRALRNDTAIANDTKTTLAHLAKPASASATGSRKLTRQAASVDCFIHFLLHGTLPWWADPTWMDAASEWVARMTAPQLTQVVELLKKHPYTRSRLAQQFDSVFITVLLRQHQLVLTNNVAAAWQQLERMPAADTSAAAFKQLQKAYWTYWIGRCVSATDVTQTALIRALQRWSEDKPWAKEPWFGLPLGKIASHNTDVASRADGGLTLLKELLVSVSKTPSNEDVLSTAPVKGTTGHSALGEVIHDATFREDINEEEHPTNKTIHHTGLGEEVNTLVDKEKFTGSDENALYVDAAGLVMLHPFLEELFRSGNLWDAAGWTSDQAQHIAVALVSWLANGERKIPEYQMTMSKLLCGMPLEVVLDVAVVCDDALLQSGTALLEAVIAHWKALGNVSPDALREGFLQRRGKIAARDGGWLITMEKKAQDVLLARLPWGISMVRLPWCGKQAIHVDWA